MWAFGNAVKALPVRRLATWKAEAEMDVASTPANAETVIVNPPGSGKTIRATSAIEALGLQLHEGRGGDFTFLVRNEDDSVHVVMIDVKNTPRPAGQ
jgi:hypothetical protein